MTVIPPVAADPPDRTPFIDGSSAPLGDATRTPLGIHVMGIVNVTPDSFSDGGRYVDTEAAIAHGQRLVDEGATIIDVGGESTRPGATRPVTEEELRRVLPVIRELAARGIVVSVDTMRAGVAAAAIDAGAVIVNDVSGGLADPGMAGVAAQSHAYLVAMHWRGHSHDMQTRATYTDVVVDVRAELAERLKALQAAGVSPDRLIVDPGLGFAKLPEHNWALLADLTALASLGFPLLIGASRKAFLGVLEAGPDGAPRPAQDRDAASAATSYACAAAGVWGVRVHDVAATVSAIRVRRALAAASSRPVGPAPPS